MIIDTKTQNITLSNGHTRSFDFLNRIHCRVKERLPFMPPTMTWPLKDICGRDFWSRLDTGERIDAGNYMKDLVEIGKLPQLRVADTKHEYPIYYQFK